jgi:hypothetical protein
MPTQATTYNSRVTDEALEKKFRDTFKSQGGAELVDDLYASGVIVPVVDFTAAAQGSQLPSNLQTAWDKATGYAAVQNAGVELIANTGFWQVNLNCTVPSSNANAHNALVFIRDAALTSYPVWESNAAAVPAVNETTMLITSQPFVVFLNAGDTLRGFTNDIQCVLDVWYRQIADVNGNLVNPLGFTSS